MLKNLLAMAKTFTYTSERLYTYLQLDNSLFLFMIFTLKNLYTTLVVFYLHPQTRKN